MAHISHDQRQLEVQSQGANFPIRQRWLRSRPAL
jgi:hypothetical protein